MSHPTGCKTTIERRDHLPDRIKDVKVGTNTGWDDGHAIFCDLLQTKSWYSADKRSVHRGNHLIQNMPEFRQNHSCDKSSTPEWWRLNKTISAWHACHDIFSSYVLNIIMVINRISSIMNFVGICRSPKWVPHTIGWQNYSVNANAYEDTSEASTDRTCFLPPGPNTKT